MPGTTPPGSVTQNFAPPPETTPTTPVPPGPLPNENGTTPPPGPTLGDMMNPGGNGGGLTGLLAPYPGYGVPQPTGNAVSAIGAIGLPQFTPPDWKQAPAFSFTKQDLMSDPSYDFRYQEGLRALDQGAAGRGVLNSGGTLYGEQALGQNMASQEYQNAWQRALGTYNTNYGTQYIDPYKWAYQGAQDSFAPKMTQYNALVGAAANQPQTDWNNWNTNRNFDYKMFTDNEDRPYDKLLNYGKVGFNAASA